MNKIESFFRNVHYAAETQQLTLALGEQMLGDTDPNQARLRQQREEIAAQIDYPELYFGLPIEFLDQINSARLVIKHSFWRLFS